MNETKGFSKYISPKEHLFGCIKTLRFEIEESSNEPTKKWLLNRIEQIESWEPFITDVDSQARKRLGLTTTTVSIGDFMNSPVGLRLSLRAWNALKGIGSERPLTVLLEQINNGEILKRRNCGIKTCAELFQALKNDGILEKNAQSFMEMDPRELAAAFRAGRQSHS